MRLNRGVVDYLWQYNNELYHYGKLGMHWGKRTSVYSTNSLGRVYSDKQKAKMTNRAVKILTKDEYTNQYKAKSQTKKAYRELNKAQNSQDKSKISSHTEKYNRYMNNANHFLTKANRASSTLNRISSGTIKAGRDFVTNTEVSTNLLLWPILSNVRIRKTVSN